MPGFSDVDGDARPLELVAILDALAALPGVAAYKARALDLLALRSGQRALDVGCGTADDAAQMRAEVGENGSCTAVDRSATMLRAASRRHTAAGLRLVQADCRRLPFTDGVFDACRADRVLHTLDDPAAALAEAVRVTRTGGRLVVSEPDWGTLALSPDDHALTRQLVRAFHAAEPRLHIGRELGALLAGRGLDGVEVHPFEGVVTRFADARRLSGLDDLLSLLPPGDVEDWLGTMEAADRAGAFRVTLGGMTAAGTVRRAQPMAASS